MSGQTQKVVRGILAFLLGMTLMLAVRASHAGSNYPPGAVHDWFDKLASGKGLCLFADGRTVGDPDWNTDKGQYNVRIDGEWYAVPNEAVVSEPNKYGPPVVWPYKDFDGTVKIRCFLPGGGA